MIHISKGNMKLGSIPNISLPPLKTCVENPPCSTLCYARRAYEGYARNTVKPAWDENLKIYLDNPGDYFAQIGGFLNWKKPEYFRWHVGGDIPDEEYLRGMVYTAARFPKTNFMAYSRRTWAWGRKAHNLIVLRSYWLDEPLGKETGFKVVPKEYPIPEDVVCKGNCASCKVCWHMNGVDYRMTCLH